MLKNKFEGLAEMGAYHFKQFELLIGRKATKLAWIFLHDVLAHPVCGLLWILGFSKAGDWLHEASLHPLNYQEERWSELSQDSQ